jgi:hypothetical protein
MHLCNAAITSMASKISSMSIAPNVDQTAASLFLKGYVDKQCPDVILRAWGKDYAAHKILLLSQSEYFEKQLSSYPDGLDKSQGSTHLSGADSDIHKDRPCPSGHGDIPVVDSAFGDDVTKKGFEFVLEYLYCSSALKLCSENVLEVLSSALFFQVSNLVCTWVRTSLVSDIDLL